MAAIESIKNKQGKGAVCEERQVYGKRYRVVEVGRRRALCLRTSERWRSESDAVKVGRTTERDEDSLVGD